MSRFYGSAARAKKVSASDSCLLEFRAGEYQKARPPESGNEILEGGRCVSSLCSSSTDVKADKRMRAESFLQFWNVVRDGFQSVNECLNE